MDLPNKKPFREWQIFGLILIALIALGFGQAVKKRPTNFPTTLNTPPSTTPLLATTSPLSRSDLGSKIRLKLANGTIFTVEVAQTEAEQQRGLSGRSALGQDEGMLFIYSTTTTPRFWMKGMNFALDIIWLDHNKKIVDITPDLAPDTYPQTFAPKTPIQYVLEVPAGTAAKNNLQIGNLIHFSLEKTL